MKKTSYISALLLAASALLLASCAKELGGNGNENYLSFSSNIAEIVQVKSGVGVQADTDSPARFVTLSSADGNKSLQMELSVEPNTSGLCGSDYAGTKAALQTEASSFYAMGFNGTQRWFPNSSTPQQVTVGQTYSSYIWVDGASYNFFAYANMPASTDVAEASITKDGVSLNYKAMPTDAAAQYDILLGRYSGIGKDAGTAEMTFYHPMTAVIFKVGRLDASITTVKSISIDGVYASGSTSLASGAGIPTFSWSGTSSTKEVNQNINSLPGEGQQIGVPFVLIPQNLATQNVTVNLIATTADGDILLTTTLNTGSWEAGNTYTYKVNRYGPDSKFWVDMDLLSEDGYPLFVSKYNISSISNTGEITFAKTVDGGAEFNYDTAFSSADPDNLKYLGEKVHLMKMGEAISMLNPDYYSFNVAGANDFSITRIIGGRKLDFKSSNGYFLLNGKASLSVKDTDIYVDYPNDNLGTGSVSGGCIKVVYEFRDDNYKESLPDNGENLYYTYHPYACSRELDASQPTRPKKIEWGTTGITSDNFYFVYTLLGLKFENHPVMFFHEVNNYYSYNGYYRLKLFCDHQTRAVTNPDLFKSFIRFRGGSYAYGKLALICSKWSEDSKWIGWTINGPCFLPGTLITLADGSRKPVEEITYDDELKVWNFDKGCYDIAKVLWLTKKGLKNDHYVKCTFSDGTVLNVTGERTTHHKLYNYTDRFFEPASQIELGKEVFTENGIVTLVSRELVEEEVEYYNLITDKHINCFANGVLTSSRYNNSYPINENMKFIDDGRRVRPYIVFAFAGISREWYDGLRLGEQDASLESIKAYIDRLESYMQEKPQEENPGFFARIRNWFRRLFGKE